MEGQYQSRLTESRKNKLLDIKKREELKDVLVNKIREQLPERRGMTPVIHSEVDKLCDNAPVTKRNLRRLEKRIGQKVFRPQDDDARSEISRCSSYTMGSVSSRRSSSSSAMGGGRRRGPHSAGGMVVSGRRLGTGEMDFQDFEWSKLDEYASYLHEQDAMRQKLSVVDMQQRMREDLDRQLLDQRLKKDRQRDEDHRYYQAQVAEIEQWRELEKQKQDDAKAKNAREKQMRDEQLALNRRIREEETDKRKQSEKALVDKINREMDAERQRVQTKKAAQRNAMAKIMKENQAEREMKEHERQRQLKLDQEGIQAYNQVLDAQEAQRQDELEGRMKRQLQLMERMQNSVVAQQNEKNDEDARRAAQQREEADARAIEMERNKQEKLRQMRQESQEFLFKQMAEKDEKKRQALELKRLQAAILEADTQEYVEIEKRRAEERRSMNVEHRKELERHIATRSRQDMEDKFCMSAEEIRMNKQLLQVVDRTLKERDYTMDMLGPGEEELSP